MNGDFLLSDRITVSFVGVMEYWSIGLLEYCNANLYSNTPVLQNSILFNPVNIFFSSGHMVLSDYMQLLRKTISILDTQYRICL